MCEMQTSNSLCGILNLAAMGMFIIVLASLRANAQTTDYNLDFEAWHADQFGKDRLDQWVHIGWVDDTLYQLQGTKRSTQRHSGTYAVTLHRWYIIDRDAIRLRQGISHKPRFINGYYSYTEIALAKHADSATVNDIATVTAYFTRWNALRNRPDTIGYGYLELGGAATFTPFSCALTYTDARQPDSFAIYIRPSKFFGIGCKFNPDCSFLTVDALSFQDAASVARGNPAADLTVSPNPVKNELTIRAHPAVVLRQIELADATGRIVLKQDGALNHLQLDHLPPGYYVLSVRTDEATVIRKVVIE